MTGALDSNARALADRLTNKFGKPVTLRRITQSAYDETTDTGGVDQAPVDYSVNVTPPEGYMLANLNNSLVEAGDQVISLPALNAPVVPNKQTDFIVMDGSEWVIKQVGRLYSGELVAMYILLLGQ